MEPRNHYSAVPRKRVSFKFLNLAGKARKDQALAHNGIDHLPALRIEKKVITPRQNVNEATCGPATNTQINFSSIGYSLFPAILFFCIVCITKCLTVRYDNE
jgi:hypothetical protein